MITAREIAKKWFNGKFNIVGGWSTYPARRRCEKAILEATAEKDHDIMVLERRVAHLQDHRIKAIRTLKKVVDNEACCTHCPSVDLAKKTLKELGVE